MLNIDEIAEHLKCSTLFKQQSTQQIKNFIASGRIIELKPDQILFEQGDSSDAMYLVLSGTLVAYTKTNRAKQQLVIGYLRSGELVGEIGALGSLPRTLSVAAKQSAKLLRLETATLFEKLEANPSLFAPITKLIINRLSNSAAARTGSRFAKVTLFVANQHNADLTQFVERFTAELQQLPIKTIVLQAKDFAQRFPQPPDDHELMQFINEFTYKYEFVFFCLNQVDSRWFTECVYKAERLVVIVNEGEQVLTSSLTHLLGQYSQHLRCELLALQHDNDSQTSLSRFSTAFPFALYHKVNLAQPKTIQRLCRFMTGTMRGLVLSGGGFRAWVHVGVIKACVENGIEIDILGGTSAGGIVAMAYAKYHDLDQTIAIIRKCFNVEVEKVKKYTLPIISILDGEYQTNVLRELFADIMIEDLAIPCYCVSYNLTRHLQYVHKQGLIWQATRASTAYPVLVPPMLIDGELLVDGGVLNNLPTDVMDQLFMGAGHIMAVDLGEPVGMRKVINNFPPILKLWSLLAYKFGVGHQDLRFPSMRDYIFEVMCSGNQQTNHQNQNYADLLICPQLEDYSIFTRTDPEELIARGYQSVVEALKPTMKQ